MTAEGIKARAYDTHAGHWTAARLTVESNRHDTVKLNINHGDSGETIATVWLRGGRIWQLCDSVADAVEAGPK